MGRPPSNGNPTFRFNQTEVAEMESILQEHNAQMPTRELLEALAEKSDMVVFGYSKSAERCGIGSRIADSSVVRNVSQAPQSAKVPSAVQSAGRTVSDNSQMEFEAKSARDGAWLASLVLCMMLQCFISSISRNGGAGNS
ncbi:hypothetical protein C3L33_10018, partial [Rhododendron williamsianum]